ncbi:LysR family transcriptional regulator [uncultured Ruegeria sp.]|uniref:LysR family transcriptional regulator n=1 Tax=uncultured Ruegeria sp. TaxID=259304 RepID=UPI0026098F70|nr:LysR family transcriptional regulator [uncultured Ruegeria sp.]
MSVAPKRPKGPHLNAMRAFEAAARHVSFVAAADELSVTPGAISQHIKTLEDWAGTALFRRNAQGVELTAAGASLVLRFTLAFDALADATRALRNIGPEVDFHIAALPSVAQLWLPSRLSKIRAQFPQIAFSVTAMEVPPNLSRDLFDLAIFFDNPNRSPDSRPICGDDIVPVCAPGLQTHTLDFQTATLLHDQTWVGDWALWAKKTGTPIGDPLRGPKFSLYSLAVEEAKAGAGVLIGHLCLLEVALAKGSLQRASEHTCNTGHSLCAQMPDEMRRRPETDEVVALLY